MKRVLIVDDEPSILLILSRLFSNDDVNVTACSRIEDAKHEFDRHDFQLVISDIRLSGTEGMEGLELLSHIRKTKPETPVIIMTGYGSEFLREAAYRLGAYCYYEKPFDLVDIRKKAEACGIPAGSQGWQTGDKVI